MPDDVQACELVAIGQQTNDVSTELWTRMALPGTLQPPEMEGLDEIVSRMEGAADGANPFSTSDPDAYHPMTTSVASLSSGASQVGLSVEYARQTASALCWPHVIEGVLCLLPCESAPSV